MRFKTIHVENFLCVGEANYSFEQQGLVLIEGQNKDVNCAVSNGTGKSTLFTDALTWCLFGVTTKGQKADAVMPASGKKGCLVEVRLSLPKEGGATELTIKRTRSHPKLGSSLYVEVDGKDVSKSATVATEVFLHRLLGVDRETFQHTTVMGQGLLYRFTQLTDAGRKELLESITRVSVYEQARQIAKTKIAELKAKQEVVAANLHSARAAVQSAESAVEVAKQAAERERAEKAAARTRIEAELHALLLEKQSLATEVEELSARQVAQTEGVARISAGRAKVDEMFRTAEDAYTFAYSESSQATKEARAFADLSPGLCPHCRQEVPEPYVAEHRRSAAELTKAATEALNAARESRVKATVTRDRFIEGVNRATADLRVTRAAFDVKSRQLEQIVPRESSLRLSLARLDSVSVADTVVEHAEQALAEARLRSKTLVDEVATVVEHQAYYDFWHEALQKIRVQVISKVLGYLNSRISLYCKALTDGEMDATILHDEKGKIDVRITTLGGSYASASGGEKDRLDIAIAFALHDLASSQTNYRSNILILDEIAVFVDKAGIARLMPLIRQKLDRVESCFMITQNQVFTGYADKTWTVIKENGTARLETV